MVERGPTNVPVHQVDEEVEVVAPRIKRVHPLKLPPPRIRSAVHEQPGDRLDGVCHDESWKPESAASQLMTGEITEGKRNSEKRGTRRERRIAIPMTA